MNHVAAEQIVTVLRQRGFDARVFGGPAGVQHRRGVAVRGVCVLGWRYPDGRWEFTDRPPRLIEPDDNDQAGCWIWDDILSDCCRPVASFSDPAHMIIRRVTELLPADPNKPRALCFPDFWVWDKACLASAEAPEQWYQQWSDHLFNDLRPEAARAGYSPRTARIADFMCSPRAFTACPEQQDADGGGHVYRLAPDVPLAGPLLSHLLQIKIRTDFSTWAQVGHTADPVDWPSLMNDLEQYLAWDHQQLGTSDREPDLRLQHGHSHRSREVALRVGPDGRILVRPTIAKPNQKGAQQ